ncbi:MAG: hypothetical protein MRY57_01530 [Candidatus Pacebacteria bacterium]|nr:hypothetical protein [Candidatus Paceibacterota bacterium]
MKLKIKAKNHELFEMYLTNILNLLGMIEMGGTILNESGRETLGYWHQDPDDKTRYFLGHGNNAWLNVKNKGKNFIDCEINFRYDKNFEKKKTVTKLMNVLFEDNTELID